MMDREIERFKYAFEGGNRGGMVEVYQGLDDKISRCVRFHVVGPNAPLAEYEHARFDESVEILFVANQNGG